MGDSASLSDFGDMVSDKDLLSAGMNRLVLSYKRDITELKNDYIRVCELLRCSVSYIKTRMVFIYLRELENLAIFG